MATANKQPQAVDFTEIEKIDAEQQRFSGIDKIGTYSTFGKAEDAELAISQVMIEYYEKRSKWKNGE